MKTTTLDELDRRIIHALFLDPRVPFRRLAEVLGASEQTVARRYRRLFDEHVVRVVGELDAQRLGQSDWVVRIRCVPGSALAVATRLAQHPDTAWVQLTSGGTEIFSSIHSRDRHERTPLLLGQISVGRQVVAVEAYCLLHLFDTGLSAPPGESVLSESEIEMLEAPRESKSSRDWSTATLQPTDWPLVQALAADGRATYRQLAVLTHWHESTVRRRVEELTASGALFLQVDLAFGVFGIHSTALLWMSVVPAGLTAVGEALARCPEIPFVAATTGSTNLLAALICEDDRSLYDFLNNELAGHEGLTHIEISPVTQTIKLHATMTLPLQLSDL